MRRLPPLVWLLPALTLLGAGTPKPRLEPVGAPVELDDDDVEEERATERRGLGVKVEAPGEVAAARAWWHRQRAYPAGGIPRGAYARGREGIRLMREVLRADHPGVPKPPTPPAGLAWSPLGPSPLDTTQGSLETPNMSPAAGRASAIAFDPKHAGTIYAGFALGGVWKTTDGGATWAPLMDFAPTLAVGAIAVDPGASSTIYVGTGEPAPYSGYAGQGIFKSTDGGKSFTKIGGTELDGLAVSRIVLDPAAGEIWATAAFGLLGRGQVCTNSDFDAPGQGLYRSTDAGASFSLVRAGKFTDLEIDTTATPRRILISDYIDGAFLSSDGGATWTSPKGLPTGMDNPKAHRIELAISAADPTVVYAGLGVGSASTVYVSTDRGENFTELAGAPDYCEAQCYYDNAVAADPNNPGTLYLGGSLCGIWKTENALDPAPVWVNVSLPNQDCGASDAKWFNGYVHPDVHAVVFDPTDPGTVYAATDGGIARSEDLGSTWQQVNDGLGTIQFYGICVDPTDPEVVYGGSQDNGIMKRTGASSKWTGIVAGDGATCAVDAADSGLVLASGDFATIYRSTNGFSKPPVAVFSADPGYCTQGQPGCGDRVAFIAPLVNDPSTSNTFYVGTYRLWKSAKGGAFGSWTAISDDLTAGAGSVKCPNADIFPAFDDMLTAIAVAPSSPSTLYTGSQAGVLFGTTDGGKHWARLDKAPLPGRWISAIAVDPHRPEVVYAAFSGFAAATPDAPGHVFRSADGGKSWALADIGPDLPVNTLLAHPIGSDLLYAGTDFGVLVTTDGGQSWVTLDEGLPHTATYSLAFQRSRGALVAGTHGRGAWELPFVAGPLAASPAGLSFSIEAGSEPKAQSIAVANGDPFGSVVEIVAKGSEDWLTVDPPAGLAAGATGTKIAVEVAVGDKAPGDYHAFITVDLKAGGGAISIPVALTVKKAPPHAPTDSPEGGGCGCHAAPASDAHPWLALAGLAALARLGRARRRR